MQESREYYRSAERTGGGLAGASAALLVALAIAAYLYPLYAALAASLY